MIVLASGHTSPQSVAAVKAWLAEAEEHRQAFDAERQLWQELHLFEQVLAQAEPQPQCRPVQPKRWGFAPGATRRV